MELILAAAICSVVVSILLKVAKNRGYSPLQMISWNYASASVLCFWWFQPNVQQLSLTDTPWLLILALGVLLPSVFLFLAKALQTAGILKTEIAQRLSVVLSLTAAYFIFQEQFNSLKIVGIALGIAAVLCILYSHRGGASSAQAGMLYLALVWVGYALIDVLLKYTTGLGLQFALVLNLMFICAFILSLGYILIQHKSWGSGKNIVAGLILGMLNFANIAFYVKAHMALKDSPAVVFAGMNILVVILGVISGLLFFKEKLKPSTAIGLGLGIISVMCLAYAMTA
ncbi:DMT family transporter [Acinetobacter indicus]|uniref:DMT family transporter n=1 Tax=Acinetobacter indicus TaxID=756892 RepID=A0A849NTE0_9GAMM|nr:MULTISPECIES: DMT family transporter [Acinetobacter]MCO8098922.1 DMT family transporter [Acinetobacter indicus]MCO8104476.1 DMT family transporter [Acinetobacter indicus]MCO8110150.1 DMT family transporter [Acinetobacter indicus]MCP0916191.1 DMT family transporter [Acinetobacter indicus]MCP0919317.1 DMT family transporter [Acinetobacter indicus]